MTFERLILAHPAPTLLDEDGRPVAEVATEVAGTAGTELVACPYADRRAGRPMNRSALRQLAGDWPGILGDLRVLAGPGPLDVRGALHAALLGTTRVAWFAATHPGAAVPRRIAAVYKTSLGLSQVFTGMVLADDGVGGTPLLELGGADAFFGFLDDGEWLLGQVEVCAGPRVMFGDVYRALAEGGGPRPGWAASALRVTGLAAVALVAAPAPGPDCPLLGRLRGPKGPSWTRALHGSPDRRPEDLAWWFAPGDPRRDEVLAFAERVRGLPGPQVEAELLRAVG